MGFAALVWFSWLRFTRLVGISHRKSLWFKAGVLDLLRSCAWITMRLNGTYLGKAWVVWKPIGEMILREDGKVGALGSGRGDEGGGFEEVGFGVEGLSGQLALAIGVGSKESRVAQQIKCATGAIEAKRLGQGTQGGLELRGEGAVMAKGW